MTEIQSTQKIAVFQEKEVRKTFYKDEWWFSIDDVVIAITDTPDVKSYIKSMRKRDESLSNDWESLLSFVSMKTE